MTPEQFCYWLQGLMEIQNPNELSAEQVEIIKDQLKFVLTKASPLHYPSTPLTQEVNWNPWAMPTVIC